MLKKILISILALVVLVFLALFIYLKSTGPVYDGTLSMGGLQSEVEVKYDRYGIPHIYAENSEDCYRALGYVHAQDRLFQMEMIKRLSSGRLAEVLGPKLIETDKYFKTLGLRQMAERTAIEKSSQMPEEMKKQVNAYLAGINEFVANGQTPLEYKILGIPKEEFTEVDIYGALGYMGLGFTKAMKEDPIIEMMAKTLGPEYLEDWEYDKIERYAHDSLQSLVDVPVQDFIKGTEYHLAKAGIPLWEGSNAWVVSPEKSKSGKVIFANDTHISISQASVWYEAHLNYPGFEFYGSYLASVPFGIVGHNRSMSVGLTIFPFDLMDMYRERSNPANENQVWVDDHWEDLEIQPMTIKVKDGDDVVFDRKVSRHGPILNEVSEYLNTTETEPISLWWLYLQDPTTTLEAVYQLNQCKDMDCVREGVSLIDVIGLNVLYGDVEGNIAHWAAGRLPKRPDHVNPKTILDGASGKDELLGYHDFSENPSFINPESGYVASANNDMGIVKGNYVKGYYCPDNRINRIRKKLESQEKWSQEEMKSIQLDEISDDHKLISQTLGFILNGEHGVEFSEKQKLATALLSEWDGGYGLDQVEPVIYTKMVYNVMKLCMADEIGANLYNELQSSYLYKGTILNIINDSNSIWWDDVTTKDEKEGEWQLVLSALDLTLDDLSKQLGADMSTWTWDRVHLMEHVHPIGRQKPMDKFFNVGPFSVSGGNDVPNKMMYTVDSTGIYKVTSSPALRILLDFADVEASENINPTGQSGNVMSPHYDDQAQMFVDGIYRKQLMNHDEISKQSRVLKFFVD